MTDNLPIKHDDQETRFAIALFESKTASEAGKKAGYSESTLKSGYIYKKLRDPKFISKLKSIAIANDWKDVSTAYQIEHNAIQAAHDLQESSENHKDKIAAAHMVRHIIKEKKQTTGLLQGDVIIHKPNLNIIALNARDMMRQLNNPEQVQDAEIVNE